MRPAARAAALMAAPLVLLGAAAGASGAPLSPPDEVQVMCGCFAEAGGAAAASQAHDHHDSSAACSRALLMACNGGALSTRACLDFLNNDFDQLIDELAAMCPPPPPSADPPPPPPQPGGAGQERERVPLRVGLVMPTTDNATGRPAATIAAAALLACGHAAAADGSVVPRLAELSGAPVDVRCFLRDTARDLKAGVSAVLDALLVDGAQVVVGPEQDGVVDQAANIADAFGRPLITHGSIDAGLTRNGWLVARTTLTDILGVLAIRSIMGAMQWDTVGLIMPTGTLGIRLFTAFNDGSLLGDSITPAFSALYESGVDFSVRQVAKQFAASRVTVLCIIFLSHRDVELMFNALDDAGVVLPGLAIITVHINYVIDANTIRAALEPGRLDRCLQGVLAVNIHDAVGLSPNFNRLRDAWEATPEEWYQDNPIFPVDASTGANADVPEVARLSAASPHLEASAGVVYDAVATAVLAAAAAAHAGPGEGRAAGNATLVGGERLYQEILRTELTGASGRLSYFGNGDRNFLEVGPLRLDSWVPGGSGYVPVGAVVATPTDVAINSTSVAGTSVLYLHRDSLMWPGNTAETPTGDLRPAPASPPADGGGISTGAIVGIAVAAAAACALGVLLLALLQRRQRRQDDQEASWIIREEDVTIAEPPIVLGQGACGLVLKAEYFGTPVAIKRISPIESLPPTAKSAFFSLGSANSDTSDTIKLALTAAEAAAITDGSEGGGGGANGAGSVAVHVHNLDDGEFHTSLDGRDYKYYTAVTGTSQSQTQSQSQLGSSASGTLSSGGRSPMAAALGCLGCAGSGGSAPEARGAGEAEAALREELKLLTRLRHPHVVAVLGCMGDFGHPAAKGRSSPRQPKGGAAGAQHPPAPNQGRRSPKLVLEYMANGSVSSLLTGPTSGGVSTKEAMRMACHAAAGLRYLHSQPVPICHADVKGSNILVDSGLTAKLSDFGLSSTAAALAGREATGTKLWMAPELIGPPVNAGGAKLAAEGGGAEDAAAPPRTQLPNPPMERRNTTQSDVYAFGITLYEILSRQLPYSAELAAGRMPSEIAAMAARHSDPLRPAMPPWAPAAKEWGVPVEACELMAECWATNPDRRPAIAEVHERLVALESTMPAGHASGGPGSAQSAGRQARQAFEQLGLDEAVLPPVMAEDLRAGRRPRPFVVDDGSVVFSDIVAFTKMSAGLPAEAVDAFLDELFTLFQGAADRHGLAKIDTIGDAFIAVAGFPAPQADHAERACAFAAECAALAGRVTVDGAGAMRIRAGVNSGPYVVTMSGGKVTVLGDAVNVAARMEQISEPGRVSVSALTRRHLLRRAEASGGMAGRRAADAKLAARGFVRVKLEEYEAWFLREGFW